MDNIEFSINGGAIPYTYTMTSKNLNIGPITTTNPDTKIIGLIADTYTLTIVDSMGRIIIRTITITDTEPLTANFSLLKSTSNTLLNDGELKITKLSGGIEPYKLVITRPNGTNITYNNISLSNPIINQLYSGKNLLTLSDSSQPNQILKQELIVQANQELKLNVTTKNLKCNTNNTGVINLTVTGGLQPYIIKLTNTNGYSYESDYTNFIANNLDIGNYTISVTDALNQIKSELVTLISSNAPKINIIGIDNRKQCSVNNSIIRFNIINGDLPVPYNIEYTINGIVYNKQTSTIGENTLTITELITDSLKIKVIDGNLCESNILTFNPNDISRPTQSLGLYAIRTNISSLFDRITYVGSGGTQPYTSFMPVTPPNFNILYDVPVANSITGIIVDKVGCTASVTVLSNSTPDTPNTPTLILDKIGNDYVNLSWSGSSGNPTLSGYTLYNNSTPMVTFGNVSSGTTSSLINNTTYNFTLKAFNSSGTFSNFSNTISVTMDTFQSYSITPDFERTAGNLIGNTLTLSGRSATNNDIGKVIAIKNARNYSTFRTAPITWNGYVTGVTSGNLLIGTTYSGLSYGDPIVELVNINNTEVLLGTNYYDTVHTELALALAASKSKIKFNFTGTAYVSPKLSSTARSVGTTYKGWRVLNSGNAFSILGMGTDLTNFKFGTEDNVTINGDGYTDFFNFYAINYGCDLTVDVNLISADRVALQTRHGIGAIQGVETSQRGITLTGKILGSINGGWDTGVYEWNNYGTGTGIGGNKLLVALLNTKIMASNPVTIFSQNGAVKRYYARNMRYIGGGAMGYRLPSLNGNTFVSTGSTAGTSFTGYSTTITVTDPEFTCYEHISSDPGWNHRPVVQFFPQPQATAKLVKAINPLSYPVALEIMIKNPVGVDLMDGNSHFVNLELESGFSFDTDYTFRITHFETGARLQTIYTSIDNTLMRSLYNIHNGVMSIHLKNSGGILTVYYPNQYFTTTLSKNTAYIARDFDMTTPLTPEEVSLFNDSVIQVVGRNNGRLGDGHTHYIHPNVELDINGAIISDQQRLGMRYGSDNGVAGTPLTHSFIEIRNWSGTTTQVPYFINANQKADIQLHGNNFTGIAKLGVSTNQYRYDIALPNEVVAD